MNIEEIMKPYFDKKEEISKRPEEFKNEQNEIINKYNEENKRYKEENERYEGEISALNVRLENLRNNKDREIEEYVQNAVSDRPEFYAGYGAMIRKDLEQSYLKREKELEKELEIKSKELSQKISNNYLQISVNNKLIEEQQNYPFYNVDVRELIDVKHNLRKSLISAKKELEIKLQETELRFETVMHKLSTFKYEYDENHNVLNGKEYRELFELSNSLIEVKYNLQRDLKQVDEYLALTELTEEEVKTVMMSMSDIEKEEYNRRKNIIENVEEVLSSIETQDREETNEPVIASVSEEIETEKVEPVVQESTQVAPIVPLETSKDIYDYAKETIDAQRELEHNYSAFIEEISTDVLRCVKKLRTIKVEDGKVIQTDPAKNYKVEGNLPEEIELPNGMYLNRHDIERASRNYKKQSKGRTFTVKGIDLALNVTRKSVKRVKEALRAFSLRELLNEKKISIFDVKRVYGKDKAEEYTNQSIEIKVEDYVKVEDAFEAFKELFIEKTPTWLERLTSKFKREEVDEIEDVQDAEYEQIEDTMTWNADEPEYEVVKARTK